MKLLLRAVPPTRVAIIAATVVVQILAFPN
jgi:hypothetical protein